MTTQQPGREATPGEREAAFALALWVEFGYAHTDKDKIGRPPLLEPTDPYWREAAKRLLARLAAIPASDNEGLRGLVRELAETVHQTGSIRDHADPKDTTGWNVHGIETCSDPLCVEALAALALTPEPPRERDGLAAWGYKARHGALCDVTVNAGVHGCDCELAATRSTPREEGLDVAVLFDALRSAGYRDIEGDEAARIAEFYNAALTSTPTTGAGEER